MAVDRRAARLSILALIGVLLFSLLGVRLWFLQTVQADELQARVEVAKRRTVQLLPERGRIFDAAGRLLADNERILTVGVDWEYLRSRSSRTEIFTRLSGWLEVPVDDMEARYQSGRYSPFLPLPVLEDVDERTAIALLERVEDFPGVEILNDWRRVYPYAPHAAHVVGYMGAINKDQLDDLLESGYDRNERIGQFGVEASMETYLHGTIGKRVYEVDAANRPVRLISEVEPVNGYDIQLTIDLELQQYAEQALETQLKDRRSFQVANPTVTKPNGRKEKMDPKAPDVLTYKAPAGSVVVMNHDNGHVMAMASYPTFDNRWFEAGLSSKKFQEIFPSKNPDGTPIDPDRSILVNRAVQGRYNMGSTFKPFTAYAGLRSGLISAGYYYNDNGIYEMTSVDPAKCASGLVRCTFKNANCGNGLPCRYGSVNVTDALAVSSDTFFYRVGEQIFEENGGLPILQDNVELFGFGADTGIDLPYEFDGTVPDADLKALYADRGVISEDEGAGYFAGDNVQLAIGQGLLSATPLQLATGYATFANAGFVYKPQIVKTIFEPGVPDGEIGFADVSKGRVFESFEQPTLIRQIEMGPELRNPIVDGLTRVIYGPGVESDFYHKTTGEKLFAKYTGGIRLGGKTGTAQGAGNYPWNDSSAFAAFSQDDSAPYTVAAYLEKSGYGSQAAAPVVKCMFESLAGVNPRDPVLPSDPLDLNATVAAPAMGLSNTDCYVGEIVAERTID